MKSIGATAPFPVTLNDLEVHSPIVISEMVIASLCQIWWKFFESLRFVN